ncbi:MAG TPA: ABC transporter substrate-binding protein [Lachnospiraceae bacterium]|jgi:ABC-type glycerol-3-phosphate transport system substrate-binding protein|nr:ABC transporter substrate-binding protein [Lachnospiraceae bacterium]HCR39309.1 ABC transporter substrate-binding protein [Lachnospiraceae bacterium]
MGKSKGMRRLFVGLLMITLSLLSERAVEKAMAKTNRSFDEYKERLSEIGTDGLDYKDYLAQHDTIIRPDEGYVIDAEDYVRIEDMEIKEYQNLEGMEGTAVYTGEKGLIEYEVTVEEEGFYDISLLYYPIEGKSASIQRGIFVDGELPYDQLSLVEFSRIWVDEVSEWERDNRGNDLRPKQMEAPEWILSYCYDSEGYETDRLSIYLTPGTHTLTLYSRREPMLLRKIILKNVEDVGDYQTVKQIHDAQGATDTSDRMITIHAEHANRKSSQMLYPSQDKSSPAVYPYSAKNLKNNTIGSNSSWRIVGQWLEWDFEVPESGYYYITLHARQNFVRGIYTSRKIMIDGYVPFDEMNDYGFNYKSKWTMTTLQSEEGENYRFCLEKGKHTLRMEVVLGNFSDIVSNIQDALLDINAVYRKVIRITGVEPDKYRDYNIERSIPGLVDELTKIRGNIAAELEKLREVAGKGSDREAALVTMVEQLDYLIKDIERFPKILGSFKQDVSALGTWITGVLEQPLALDTIYIHSPNTKVPEVNNSLWDRLVHAVKTLYYSFVIDYNTIGNVAEEGEEVKTITVWIGSGRDQANVVKDLIDETFTPVTNINVNVQLVDMGTLLQATLAGQGPDVAIQVGNDLPMNYGLRNAVVDLSEFDDLPEIRSYFRESAMVPYEFDGMTFGLPETETCLMMFYRKDILKELNLEVPRTWDEMKVALSVLSKNNMDLGMLPTGMTPQLAEQVFAMLLYQNGGEYYNADATASALDSDVAISVFKDYTEYYTDYKLDMEAPLDQRFRTGEAPIIISDFSLYNQLQVSAPDIKGLWGFSMIPGTVREDGKVDFSVSSTGSAAIMMSQTRDKESAWKFMKWWISADTQTQYAREMEALMGAAARYPTANIEAFDNLPWPTEDYEALMAQFEWMKGIHQVPGGYYSWRNVSNAFYNVVNASDEKKMMPREALMDYVRYINEEITFKRKEFGLPTAEY